MRALIGLAVLVLILVLIGWVSFNNDGDRPSATVETQKIEQDLDSLRDSAAATAEQVSDGLNDDRADDRVEDAEEPAERL